MASITANIDTTWSTSNLTASFNVNVGWYTDPKTHIIYKGYYAAGSLDGTKLFGELKYSASTFTTNLTIPAGYHLLTVSATNANSGESASWNADIQNFRNATSAQTVFGHDNTAGSNHIDIVYGSAFGDAFILGQNDDIVEAGGGNDFLDGGTGADRLVGGEGDDTYVVDNLGDVTYEATKEGFDTVQSSLTWTLGANVEELQLTGTAAINGTGNDAANTLRGNSAANILYGLGGNDLLFGNGGNDTLDGGAGADTLRGGLGNDTYVVDNAGDKVIEAAGEGTDKAIASVSYTLAAGSAVEQLTAKAGTTAINLGGNELGQTISGNEGANTLSGNGGNDTLLGLGGNDRLFGGAGNDVLTGGAGHDLFYFNTALTGNVDTITDFNVADDTIVLDHAIFAALAAGTLAAGAFAANTTGLAGDASDRIIYETDTGKLFYDANGSAAGGAVQFATVGHDLALTYNDFLVI